VSFVALFNKPRFLKTRRDVSAEGKVKIREQKKIERKKPI
jgi:hypothetical protein